MSLNIEQKTRYQGFLVLALATKGEAFEGIHNGETLSQG